VVNMVIRQCWNASRSLAGARLLERLPDGVALQ
jgi:hypothetical protein